MMNRRYRMHTGWAIMLVGITVGLGSLWWWAIDDLSTKVGVSSGITAFTLVFLGLIISLIANFS